MKKPIKIKIPMSLPIYLDFAFERLFFFLTELGVDVDIIIKHKPSNRKAQVSLTIDIDQDETKASVLRGINDIREGRVSKVKIKKEKPNVNN